MLRVGQCSWALPAPSRRDTHDGVRQAPSIGGVRRRGRAAGCILLPAPVLLSTARWHGSGSKRSPRGGGRRSHGVAAEDYIILNGSGRKQPPESPQCAASAPRRARREAEVSPGRSLVCDRLRDCACASGRVRGRFAVRSLRCVCVTMRSMMCGMRPGSAGVRCESAPSVDFALCVPCVHRCGLRRVSMRW